VSPGVHLPIRKGTFKVCNRREKYIHILFISKYLMSWNNTYKNPYMRIVKYIYEE